jgi:hypothetical protein
VGHQLHVQCRQIVALAECRNFRLLNPADDLSVVRAIVRMVVSDRRCSSWVWDAKQTRHRGK